ncbi:MAG: hypothetical protein H7Z72_24445 [Bacteroidetes bacterium]|nr:hypothetical protein [Fibrella sp.]
MRFFQLVALVWLLCACDNTVRQVKQPNAYYDVATFVKGQIDILEELKPTVSKALNIKGQQQTQKTNVINWSRELELFVQADINKPAFRNSYQVGRPDSLTFEYILKPGEKETVYSLRVQLDSVTQQPRQIEAVLTTMNPLYNSERRLLLESGPGKGNQWQVRHYNMTGFQQLTFFGKNDFSVEGTIN